ncbi:MAG TPA: response regulator [Anaerolineae bacterium]|nr:response regulator [Anaerolineae bacterium]
MILIAEIDLGTAATEAYYLLREGYDVRTIKSGAELIEEAEKSQPELIIMDILLPDVDGLKITEALKANKKTAHIPILIYSFLDAPERAQKAGADAFLLKPIKPAKMMGIVKELLANRKSKED